MSIITNALKKAQEARQQKTEKSSGSPSPEPGNTVSPEDIVRSTDEKKIFGNGSQKTPETRTAHSTILPVIFLAIIIAGVSTGIFLNKQRLSSSSSLNTNTTPAEKVPDNTYIARRITPEKQPGAIQQPAIKNIQDTPLPALTGIMYSVSNPKAVLNGVMVSEGDMVGEFSVVKIFPNKVHIASNGIEYELKLL